MILVAPSVLSSDFGALREEVVAVCAAGADWVHLDVMDGNFVPNLTFGAPVIAAVRSSCAKFFDAHLMVSNPDALLEDYARAGVDGITIHLEATKDAKASLRAIRALGCKAGIAVKPQSEVAQIERLLPLLDLVLIMTVEPGRAGQAFIPQMLSKVEQSARMIAGRDIRLQVDGGITQGNAADAARAGADVLVAGSAVFRGGAVAYGDNVARLRAAALAGQQGG